MEKEHELTFNEIYKKYYKAVIFEKKHYIENYFEIVYDLLKLQNFLNEKKLSKRITSDDLKELKLSVITKEEVIELFNKVINSDHNEIQYKINRKKETINNTNYEIVYMLENNKITHVKINIKNSNYQLENNYLMEIENKIVEKNSFQIKNNILALH